MYARSGYKIPSIENLGATQDQFDHFDFSDNELMKIENFPLLKRLASLTLNNNKISVIADGLGVQLPRLVRSALFGWHGCVLEAGSCSSPTDYCPRFCFY